MSKTKKRLIYNLKGEQDMNFSEFINKSWDANFCKTLALEARCKIADVISEMAMAGGEAPRIPVLYDKDDYRFLQQFPTEVWANALKWRYNDGMRMIMNHQKDPHDIPEGWDWTNEIILPSPNREHIKWKFGNKEGPKNLYIGLTDLAKKLTSPPKEYRTQTGKDKAHWAGEGPAIGEIDPKQEDPNHPEHVSKYKHGLYNFDLSGGAPVDPKDIDDMTDYEVQALLPYPLNEDPIESEQVQKAIAKKKKNMKNALKHTFAGFDVLQQDRAAESLTNWVRANGAPGNLFGPHPTEVKDPDGTVHNVEMISDPKDIKEKLHGRWNLGLGSNKQIPVQVPSYKKKFNFEELDTKNNKVTHKSEVQYIPVLNPVKALPQITLSQEQKEQLEKIRGKKNVVTSAENLQGLLNIWDVLTDDQKKYLKDHSKTAFQVAQSKWNKDSALKDRFDPQAHPKNIYATGFYPNYKEGERGSFSLPPEKTDAFIKKYYPKIFAEVLGSDATGKGKIDRILDSFKKSGKHPPQVIEALENKAPELAQFATYMLLGWLDDPRFGIKDDELGLLKDVPAGSIDEEDNKERRERLVYNFISSVAQVGFNDVLSRRRRERYGIATKSSIDQAMGDSGESGAGNIAAGQKGKIQHVDTSAKRAWLHSDPSSIVRSSWKTNKMFSHMTEFLSTKRNYILSKLNGSTQAASDLKSAQDKIGVALQTAQKLYAQYDAELASKYPNAEEREAEVMKLVHQNLTAAVAKNVGELSQTDQENILAQLKDVGKVGLSTQHSAQIDAEAKKVYDEFLDRLGKNGEGIVPIYNVGDNTFIQSSHHIDLEQNFPKNNPKFVVDFIQAIYHSFPTLMADALKNKGPKIYATVQELHDSEKDEEQNKADYLAALAKTQEQVPAQTQPQPQQAPQQTPAAPQAIQPQQQLAAKAVGDLINHAANFNTREEMTKAINDIMARRNEFLANPEEAKKLNKLATAIRTRSAFINTQEPLQPQDYVLLKKFNQFVGGIGDELDQ